MVLYLEVIVTLAALGLSFYAVLLNASLGRPIWMDEFLHFAFGSFSSTGEAWQAIRQSTKGVNHGQTGIYMLLNYWSLSLFGANKFILRLPSIASGLILFWSVFYIFWLLRFSAFWQVVAVTAVFCQSTLMYFAGEARPYMPLAGASVAILAYYLTPLAKRRTPALALFGLFSAVLGATMHPYFALYWPGLCMVAFAHHCWSGELQWGLRTLLAHANVPLCVIGTTIYSLVAFQTWLIGGPKFTFDPFQWVHEPSVWVHFFNYCHFQFLDRSMGAVVFVSAISVISLAATPERLRGSLQGLWTPITLLVVAITISLLLMLVCYLRSYWILPRQWVASAALVAVAFIPGRRLVGS